MKTKHEHIFITKKSGMKICACGKFQHREGVEEIISAIESCDNCGLEGGIEDIINGQKLCFMCCRASLRK